MKTVRFSVLVDRSGKPDNHLLLVKPEDDKSLQRAIRTKRVVTVFLNAAGNRTDSGEVGFHPGSSRQYLVFPKSVDDFGGRKVVGIKYELLQSTPVPKKELAERPAPPPKRKSRSSAPKKTRPKPAKKTRGEEAREDEASPKVLKFPETMPAEPEDEDDDSEEIAEIKAQVRRAMAELEKGKDVAAFNLLKRIVGD